MVEQTSDSRSIFGGEAVEARGDFVFEGAWAGPLSAEGMSRSEFRCGSGVILREDGLRLIPPTHSLDVIYVFVAHDFSRVVASNSAPAVVALAPEAAPAQSLNDVRKLGHTLIRGFLAYERLLWWNAAGVMYRLAWEPVEIDFRRRTVSQPGNIFAPGSPFQTYEAYRDHLVSTMAEVTRNARDPARRAPYGQLITSCSAGYDSSAAAALARRNGCREAVTLATAKGGDSDSGRPVAEALGLEVSEFERFGVGLEVHHPHLNGVFVEADKVPEGRYDDFLGTLNTSEDMVFAAFEEKIAGAVFVTGFHGDKVWNTACDSGPQVRRGDNSGSGLDNFRQRVGFVHLPAPFIGARHYAEIRAITQSAEMAPWRLGGRYDRPLPRRIVEEAGVPRELFGRKKMAGSVDLRPDRETTLKRRKKAFDALVAAHKAALVGVAGA